MPSEESDNLRKYLGYAIEATAVISVAVLSLFLQYGTINFRMLGGNHAILVISGGLVFWFLNKFVLDHILQKRIDANGVTPSLPILLLSISFALTSLLYIIVYLIFGYLEGISFVLINFLKGYLVSLGLTLLIVILYLTTQIWLSWWRDGKVIFTLNEIDSNSHTELGSKNYITIQNSQGTTKFELDQVQYFVSESKVVFLVDTSGKKRVTQYSLFELEDILGIHYFRLNRKILVSHNVITEIKKLPNHRLLVTIGTSNDNHQETISRYKSTRFKEWYRNTG